MVSDEPIGNRAIDGVSDLTLISNIDEFGINENLRVRYEKQQIYVSLFSSLNNDLSIILISLSFVYFF